jgi:hypothetical protein
LISATFSMLSDMAVVEEVWKSGAGVDCLDLVVGAIMITRQAELSVSGGFVAG